VIAYPGNAQATKVYPPYAASGSGDGQHWVCGSSKLLTLGALFVANIVIIGQDSNGNQIYGTLFTNSSWDDHGGNIDFGILLPNADPSSKTAGWGGWTVGDGNGTCARCI
jgi:hypothetical protein